MGVTEGWAPHGIRRWGSRRSLGTRSSSLRCTTCQQAQRLTGLNCLPLCVAVLGAPHVIYDHAAAAAPVAAGLCTSVALCSPNHGYPADHWGACNRDSRTCHVACVGEPRTEVERYSINFFFFTKDHRICECLFTNHLHLDSCMIYGIHRCSTRRLVTVSVHDSRAPSMF